MATVKAFLIQECSNVGAVLEETLRYKYGPEGSREFYEECQARLDFISTELGHTPQTDSQTLTDLGSLLNQLSKLIWRIERSSLGEYSWPFVYELKTLATPVCSEATLTSPMEKPLIHVLANGGLDAYAIHTEPRRPSGSRKRIHTIVFPSSLKHFVLLHTILGHEIGHAVFRCTNHQQALVQFLNATLCAAGSSFESAAATAKWLYSADAPTPIKNQLAKLQGITAGDYFSKRANWHAWVEELLCDAIGVLTFGPSFIAAECDLLHALDPTGLSLGPNHPPVAFRVNLMLRYASALGYSGPVGSTSPFEKALGRFWSDLNGQRIQDAWFDSIADNLVNDALFHFGALLRAHPPALYVQVAYSEIELMYEQLIRCVPPVGFKMNGDDVSCGHVDFRHTLYAGWIASNDPNAPNFETVNRLCEHGIMQQRAVELQLSSSNP